MKTTQKPLEENKSFDHKAIQAKWDLRWARDGIYEPDLVGAKNPFYNLMMFPYPSAEGLHVGNMYAFCGSDIYGRFMRMQGKDVFEPIGLDGFGIHSENYALKVGEHPMKLAERTEANFYKQLHMIGNGYAWGSKLETYRSNYYKWTQYIFTLMFKSGLAYRDRAKVNWCPSCLTVLSDEQVVSRQLGRQDTGILGEEKPRNQIFVCERCGTEVVKKELTQWFFKITKYAGRLLEGLEKIDWSEKVKIIQKNWIGKSKGARIRFTVDPSFVRAGSSQFTDRRSTVGRELRTDNYIEVFTTRPDTIYGATFLVLAPEHPLVTEIINGSKGLLQKEIREYVETSIRKTEAERQDAFEKGAKRGKSGVKTGFLAQNPLSKKSIPVFIAEYVLTSYGTGAVMGVPAHDQRDWDFAIKYHIDIVQVIKGGNISREAFTGSGKLINSGGFNGQDSTKAINTIINYIEEHQLGFKETRWHLRDWIISRQRYWGPPIPMIFCENCAKEGRSWFTTEGTKASKGTKGTKVELIEKPDWNHAGWYPVSDRDLPVELPYVENFKPTGSGASPLATESSFVNVKCPGCGRHAKRETDVSDTFLDSAWYFLRYPSISGPVSSFPPVNARSNVQPFKPSRPSGSSQPTTLRVAGSLSTAATRMRDKLLWNPEITRRWLPVDMYIGGAEHSVLHLLYSRFLTKVFYDLGLVAFDEPFKTFRAHGLLIKDGAKMSKSKGNVVNPDDYIEKYGADTLRSYLMFCGRFEQGGDFRDSGIEGMSRFLKRVLRLVVNSSDNSDVQRTQRIGKSEGLRIRESEGRIQSDNLNFRHSDSSGLSESSEYSEHLMHKTIKKVTSDIASLNYNTAISAIMEWVNSLEERVVQSVEKSVHSSQFTVHSKQLTTGNREPITKKEVETLVLLLAPFAPYLCEELWELIGNKFSVHTGPWPRFDERLATSSEVVLVIQVNGKVRDTVRVARGVTREEAERLALASVKVKKFLVGKKPKKVVFVTDKLINFVT